MATILPFFPENTQWNDRKTPTDKARQVHSRRDVVTNLMPHYSHTQIERQRKNFGFHGLMQRAVAVHRLLETTTKVPGMPLDGHSYLVAQGWSGNGSGLRQGAISRPLAISQKKTLSGLGKDRDEAFPFWDQ